MIDFKCFKAAAPYAFVCQKEKLFVDNRDNEMSHH